MKKRGTNLRRALATFSIAIGLFIATVPTFASAEQQANEATEKLEYTVVTDKAGLLSAEQVQNIEKKVNELEEHYIALYVENTDPDISNEDYVAEISEEVYAKEFGRAGNGIVVVFSFFKEANGYYDIRVGNNVKVSKTNLNSIIEGTYHDFKTDATWVEGSFLQCIDSLKTAEVSSARQDSAGESKLTKSEILAIILLIIIGAATIIIMKLISKLRNMKEYVEHIEECLKIAKERNSQYETKFYELTHALSKAEADNKELQDWKTDAICIVKDIDDKINDMRAKREASDFDRRHCLVQDWDITVKNFEEFDKTMESYSKVSGLAKKYITCDIRTISEKRKKAGELYAAEATRKMEDVCSRCSGTRYNRAEINDTMQYYNGLPMYVKMMIAKNVVNRLNAVQKSAEADYSRHNSYSSSRSSYSHTSSMGGHFGTTHVGGHFGGGH